MISRFGDSASSSHRSSAPADAAHKGEMHRLSRALRRRRRSGEPGSYSVSCVRKTCPHDDCRGFTVVARARTDAAPQLESRVAQRNLEQFKVKTKRRLFTPSVDPPPPHSTSSSAPMGSRVLSSRGQKWTCRSSEQNATTLPSGEKRTLRTVWPPTWSSVSAPM